MSWRERCKEKFPDLMSPWIIDFIDQELTAQRKEFVERLKESLPHISDSTPYYQISDLIKELEERNV